VEANRVEGAAACAWRTWPSSQRYRVKTGAELKPEDQGDEEGGLVKGKNINKCMPKGDKTFNSTKWMFS